MSRRRPSLWTNISSKISSARQLLVENIEKDEGRLLELDEGSLPDHTSLSYAAVSSGVQCEEKNTNEDRTIESIVPLNSKQRSWTARIRQWHDRYRRIDSGDEVEETPPTVRNDVGKTFDAAEYLVALSHFRRIYSYATPRDKMLITAACLASTMSGVTLPLMNVVFGQLVGTFSSFYRAGSGETSDMFENTMDDNVRYLVYLFIARLCLAYVAVFGFRISSIRISAAIRLAYLEALFKQPISTLDVLPPGQTAAIITITANTLQVGISEKLSTLIQSTSLVVAALFIAFDESWQLTLVTSIGLVFIVIFYALTIPALVRKLKKVEEADRMSSSIASEVFSSIRMIAACQAEGKVEERYAQWVQESQRRGLSMSSLVAIQQAPVFFAIHATFALSFWFAIQLYREEKIESVTTMIIVLMSIMSIVMSIGSIAAPVSAAVQAASAAGIMFSIIDAPLLISSMALKGDVASARKDVVLENVNFAYPVRHEVKVLTNVSLRLSAGQTTAIVGASGSGKSTIVGLLERWYQLDGNLVDNATTLYFRNGTIKIGDHNLHDIDIKWWRSQIGLVQQEPFLFNDTIYRNVEFGLIGTEWEHAYQATKRKLVTQACKEAFADEFIQRLPQGYDTSVGDAGLQLSGGQRQRIAIARAIVKQPAILILDEATSAIDVRGERMVQAALDRVSRGRTTVTIAHRLSTIMKADNIVVLKKGLIVQQGTHSDLIADKAGAYYALASAQQLSVRADVVNAHNIANEEINHKHEILEKFSDIDLTADNFIPGADQVAAYEARQAFGGFRHFIWECWGSQWLWYSIMILSCIGAGLAFPTQSFLFAKLISLFNFWGQELSDLTNFWCLMFTLLALGVGASYFALGWSSNTISFNITAIYRQEYFKNMLARPISYFDHEENSIGSLTGRVATDPTQLQQLLGINSAVVLLSVINILGSIGISFYFGWKLTLFTVCSAMPVILAAGFFRIQFEIRFEKKNQAVFAESSKFATESISAFRTVSALTLESKIIARYKNLLDDHTAEAYRTSKLSTLVFALSDSISLLCMAFVMWYGGFLLSTHEYLPFNYLVIYLAVVQGSTAAGQSLSFGPNVAQAFAAANRIRGMRSVTEFDSSTIESIPYDEAGAEMDDGDCKGLAITFQDVFFKYPARDAPVLNGLSMTIKKGQFAAIVGPSGCGKTSIISLIERFYHIQSGRVLCNGADISKISLTKYRKRISLVAQESSVFDGSIRENLLLGVDEDTISAEELQQVCINVELHDFVSSLPEGYETQVGGRGVALSGGQRQRIAIARALLRDPAILLLDEATSALDSETERSVQAVFERTAKNRTMVVVAHRLATIQNADVIFVISDGRVVERGTHPELLGLGGIYHQMCHAQALDR